MSYGVGGRHGSDPELLWLRCRLVATALIGFLASLGTSICCGCSPKKDKKTKKKSDYRESRIHIRLDIGVLT